MQYHILTASHLKTGQVVFLDMDNQWSTSLHAVQLSDDKCSAALLEATGEKSVLDNEVIGPYLIAVTLEDGKPIPVRYREQLRILGPSIHQQFSKPVYERANLL